MLRVCLALLLALTVAGCAAGNSSVRDFKGSQRAVADVIADLQKAGQRKDEGKVCTQLLTRALAQQMTARGATCEDEVNDAFSDADDFDITVKAVVVRGASATATVENADRVSTFRLVRTGAEWRIASLGA